MKYRLRSLEIVLLTAGLAGCSGGDSAPTGGEATVGALEGKAPGKASQFEGRWVRVGEAEFDSMEFTKDGKAIVGGEDAGLTVDYALLEGGRLSLTLPGGMTTVYEATLSGDQLQLRSAGNLLSEAGTFRYRRLGKDETVKGVLQEQARTRAQAWRERVEALERFLAQPNLVLAFPDGGPSGPASIALDIQGSGGSFSGKAWHDDRPPHLNAIDAQLQLDEASRSAQVRVTYGQRIAPPATQPDGGGQIVLSVDGEGKGMRIRADVTFGGSGPSHEMVLRPDAELHREIVARYEAELARIEALKQPLVALLKDYAVLRGELQSRDQRSAEADTTELTLVRDPASGEYWCAGVFIGPRGRGELVVDAGAEIAVADDRPLLRIVTPPARQYLLGLPDPSAAKLTGKWTAMGQDQGHGARFDVAEALDSKARDAKFEARRRTLKSLDADSVFTGLAFEDSGFGMEMPVACRLQLSLNPDGTVAGVAHYPTLATRMTVAGRLAETRCGPRLELSYTAAESTPGDKIFFRSIQGGAWHLTPAGGDGSLELEGHFTGPPLRPATLIRADRGSTDRLRRRLVEVMDAGARFHVARFVGWQTPGIAPTVVELKLDGASGEITGHMVVDGRALGTNEKLATRYEGRLEEEDGWLVLKLVQISTYRPSESYFGALALFVAEDDRGVLHLNGALTNQGAVPTGQPAPAFPAAFDRLVELVPVADSSAETRASIEASLASLEQARAEAEAAARAAEQAALEARRAKLAPFFPLFQTEAGLVITTNGPPGMGTVLTESRVDPERATITGKGVDLREMPFRDCTFACGLDNWGNLTVTTSTSETPYAFAAPRDGRVAAGRAMALTLLSDEERADLDALAALGRRLQTSAQAVLTVETLDAATAKAREAGLNASSMPGVAIYRNARNDRVAAMFTAQSNGRYLWTKEPVTHRLDHPMTGRALYIRNGGPTDNLVVVINGVHRAVVPAIVQHGAAVVSLPPDLEILDLRLQADGTAQARGVALVP